MSRHVLWIPFAVVLFLAALVGYRFGQVPGETEIINRYAARYVAEQGGDVTDCAARPDPRADVRMVIECTPAQGPAVVFVVGPRGAEVVSVAPVPET